MIDRRTFLIGAAVVALMPRIALAQNDGRDAGFHLDWQGEPVDPKLAPLYADQVARVKALPIAPDIIDFFSRQPIFIIKRPGIGSFANPTGAYLTRDPWPPENPVLLHELIHCYHIHRLAGTPRAAELRALFAAAKAKPDWPANAYMYKNLQEFFAMTASVVLSGRAARPPYTRAAVKQKLPALYDFIVREFSFRG